MKPNKKNIRINNKIIIKIFQNHEEKTKQL